LWAGRRSIGRTRYRWASGAESLGFVLRQNTIGHAY
jgi:hypothetical protein